MASKQPVINGHRYSYVSLRVVVNGMAYEGIKSITYSSSLTPGIIYGSDPYKVGRTPGKVEHTCELEIYRREWTDIMERLGQSFGRPSFDIDVQYAEKGDEGVTQDLIALCRVTHVEFANEEGSEPSAVHVTVDPMDIRYGRKELSIDNFQAAFQGEVVL